MEGRGERGSFGGRVEERLGEGCRSVGNGKKEERGCGKERGRRQ